MTDHESRQFRDDLMSQFYAMMTEPLPACPPEMMESFPLPWASQY